MNKIAQGLLGATAAILLLAGCSAVSAEAQDKPSVASSSSSTPRSEPSGSGPVTLVPDTSTPSVPTISDEDATFVKEVRTRIKGMDSTSDADLIAAGHYACDLYAQGQTRKQIDIIKGDSAGEPEPGWNDNVLAYWGAYVYCPQYRQS